MSAIELEPGEVVDLELCGLRVAWVHDGDTNFKLPTTEAGKHRYLTLCLDDLPADAVTVTRAVPLDGRPEPGDVWTDTTGDVWFATKNGREAEAVAFCSPDGRVFVIPWRDVHNGPYGPIRLAYRPDPPKPTEPPPADVRSCSSCRAYIHLDSEHTWVDDAGYATCEITDGQRAHQPEE